MFGMTVVAAFACLACALIAFICAPNALVGGWLVGSVGRSVGCSFLLLF
jgi:hypothetical protein